MNVNIEENHDLFELMVADDGVGFDPLKAREGHGLTRMRERAEKLGGKLSLNTRPGAGTEVRLTLQLS